MNYADEIKARLTMSDILNEYGFRLVMSRMPCPFHSGKDRNFSVKNNRSYRCWVCGESGDVITFVQRYFGLDFKAAVAKINDDFRLGLPLDEDREKQKEHTPSREASERAQRLAERKQEAAELLRMYDDALEDFVMCDTILTRCRPISPSTGMSDTFAWAAKNIDRLWFELKEIEAKVFDFDQREKKETV